MECIQFKLLCNCTLPAVKMKPGKLSKHNTSPNGHAIQLLCGGIYLPAWLDHIWHALMLLHPNTGQNIQHTLFTRGEMQMYSSKSEHKGFFVSSTLKLLFKLLFKMLLSKLLFKLLLMMFSTRQQTLSLKRGRSELRMSISNSWSGSSWHCENGTNLWINVTELVRERTSSAPVWILGLFEVLGRKSNEWVANPLGPGQTSALQV